MLFEAGLDLSENLQEKIRLLKENIERCAEQSGRSISEIHWILVSKTVPCETIRAAYDLGVRDFGENKVQELLQKRPKLPDDIRWHFIGHLQSNKIKDAVGKTDLIHSLDRREMADKIVSLAEKNPLPKVRCLIQVNSSGESSKFGLLPEEVEPFVDQASAWDQLEIKGLMTIGPLTDNQAQIRRAFRGTKQLFDRMRERFPVHPWEILSMGMSHDYEIAIEEGSSLLRIGTAVFGDRVK